ncbi:MAG: type III ribulose-bisphosphate carboxylase [Candidatus Ranarchaeia archaeon]
MKYVDYIDLDYKPSPDDLICDFFVDPKNIPFDRAAGGVAAESSIGTWTDLTTIKPYIMALQARVFSIDGKNIRIAYPNGLFEPGNIPNILSSIAGNVFGLGEIANLRLNDIHFPTKVLRGLKGPRFGIAGIRHLLRVKTRPLVGTIVKPKLGLKTVDHAHVAYEAWVGGCDIVKDDENLSNQRFNKFENRVDETLKMRDKAENETGERKMYMVNVTAETKEMIRRAKYVKDQGGEYIMVDILTIGFAALQTIVDENLGMVFHAHRAGHAAFTRNQKHGINMRVIAKIARAIGMDQLHVGTAVGKMSENRADVLANVNALRDNWGKFKQTMPVASGGLHPGLVDELIDIFGNNVVIQAGGGIHGHPRGTRVGATALRQAVDAVLSNESLEDYAKAHKPLAEALHHWGK